MSISRERERLLQALHGKRGFLGVRVRLGRPSVLCIDVSPGADTDAIRAVLDKVRIANATEIVPVQQRHVGRALASHAIR